MLGMLVPEPSSVISSGSQPSVPGKWIVESGDSFVGQGLIILRDDRVGTSATALTTIAREAGCGERRA